MNSTCIVGLRWCNAYAENDQKLSSFSRFMGSAGQSFGCFLTPGMNIRLVGEANDYVGKVVLL